MLFAKQERLLEVEREISARLKHISELSQREKQELLKVLEAKDREIEALENQNRILERKKNTLWQTIRVVVVAGAAGLLLGELL